MEELLKRMHKWMNDYMKSFYSDDEEVQQGILIKENHTGYVTTNSIELANYLQLNQHDSQLAEIIGLFHDVGRFRQYSLYKSFNDSETEDHADLGIKVIDELNFFDELSDVDNDLVHFAIKNHNKRFVEPTNDERKSLFTKIIRDADKLDIYRVLEPFLDPKNIDKMPNYIKGKDRMEISADFVKNFIAGNQADYTKIETMGDRKIVRLMWIYDINFAWTMKKIVERGYIEKIINALPPTEGIEIGIKRLREHIEKICNSCGEL